MNETEQQRVLWYTRRDGVVRGPYRQQQLSRYVLLGRIRDDYDVCPEGGDWVRLDQRPDLVPDLLLLPPNETNRHRLQIARQRADERGPSERRRDRAGSRAGLRDLRGGVERRRPADGDTWRYRDTGRRAAPGGQTRRFRYPLAAALMLACGFLVNFLHNALAPGELPPECAARARPGVNWTGCNLSGLAARHANLVGARLRDARLDAVDLSFGDLHHADLSNASLVGMTARGADLREARLRGADLAYANLSDTRLEGADLSGADLSNAIWVDRKPCLAGSIGTCRRVSNGPRQSIPSYSATP
jgi:hypothetical protein